MTFKKFYFFGSHHLEELYYLEGTLKINHVRHPFKINRVFCTQLDSIKNQEGL